MIKNMETKENKQVVSSILCVQEGKPVNIEQFSPGKRGLQSLISSINSSREYYRLTTVRDIMPVVFTSVPLAAWQLMFGDRAKPVQWLKGKCLTSKRVAKHVC